MGRAMWGHSTKLWEQIVSVCRTTSRGTRRGGGTRSIQPKLGLIWVFASSPQTWTSRSEHLWMVEASHGRAVHSHKVKHLFSQGVRTWATPTTNPRPIISLTEERLAWLAAGAAGPQTHAGVVFSTVSWRWQVTTRTKLWLAVASKRSQ